MSRHRCPSKVYVVPDRWSIKGLSRFISNSSQTPVRQTFVDFFMYSSCCCWGYSLGLFFWGLLLLVVSDSILLLCLLFGHGSIFVCGEIPNSEWKIVQIWDYWQRSWLGSFSAASLAWDDVDTAHHCCVHYHFDICQFCCQVSSLHLRVTDTSMCAQLSTPYCYVIFMTRPMVTFLKYSICCKHMNSSSATRWSIQHLFQIWDTVMMLITCLPYVNIAYWILFKLSLLGTMFPRLLASATSSV